ncbi:hypothetical protein CC2G_002562 [Coprinopsis cinerea AmutBmut pab1-1]|nr:hypothetical protein CC2G_002562 [Coprinopsis cinerea AmutBmut pab1-1]
MFSAWRKAVPAVSIFHHASSPPSNKALNILRSAISAPYPPTKTDAPPLEYNLEVIESPPTIDQLKTIMSYLPSKATSPSMAFLSAHPSSGSASDRPQTIEGIIELAGKNPQALRWPIVVNWNDGQVAIGTVDGRKKLNSLRDGLRRL